jgi:hypothetical protein
VNRSALETLSQAIAPAAIVVFGLQYVSYDRFYSALGLAPTDVGLNYANVLLKSATLLASAVLTAIPMAFLAYGRCQVG